MGLVYGGKTTVRDGLALELDAANQKSWNGGNTWKDNSAQGNDLSLLNGLTHSQGPFPGAGYVDFDGNGDAINITHNNTLDGDFTVECWVRLNTNSTMMVGSSGYDYNTQWMRFNHNSTGNISSYFDAASGGTAGAYFFQNVAGGITTNKWHHVAICRSGTNTRLFVDGDLKATNTSFTGAPRFDKIGALYVNGSLHTLDPNYFNGSISNVRVLDGTALYTSNFTPPKGPLENISNTTLLTCQGSSVIDASDNSSSISLVGNATAVYNSQSYFHFDGSDDYISFASASELQFLNRLPYTMEVWMYPTSNPGASTWTGIFNREDSSVGSRDGYNIYLNGSTNQTLNLTTERFCTGTVTEVGYTYNESVLLNIWHHVVATYDGTTLRLYRNGEQVNSGNTTGNITNTSKTLEIGRRGDGSYFNGRLNGQKIYNKALTVSEIQQNFNALRSRYGV